MEHEQLNHEKLYLCKHVSLMVWLDFDCCITFNFSVDFLSLYFNYFWTVTFVRYLRSSEIYVIYKLLIWELLKGDFAYSILQHIPLMPVFLKLNKNTLLVSSFSSTHFFFNIIESYFLCWYYFWTPTYRIWVLACINLLNLSAKVTIVSLSSISTSPMKNSFAI